MAVHHCERRLELMREKVYSRVASASQRARRCVRRDHGPTGAAPSSQRDMSKPRWPLNRFDRIEGRDDAALDAGLRDTGAGQREDLTLVVPSHVHDPPAAAADADDVTGTNGATSGFGRARPLPCSRRGDPFGEPMKTRWEPIFDLWACPLWSEAPT